METQTLREFYTFFGLTLHFQSPYFILLVYTYTNDTDYTHIGNMKGVREVQKTLKGAYSSHSSVKITIHKDNIATKHYDGNAFQIAEPR